MIYIIISKMNISYKMKTNYYQGYKWVQIRIKDSFKGYKKLLTKGKNLENYKNLDNLVICNG